MRRPGEVWTSKGKPTLDAEQKARHDAIIASHSRNRQGRRAAIRALRKAGLA